MMLPACSSSKSIDLTNECVRAFLGALFPAALVVVLVIAAIPCPRPLSAAFRILSSPWKSFLTLSEAEAYEHDEPALEEVKATDRSPLWFTLFLVVAATVEVIAWTVFAAFTFSTGNEGSGWYVIRDGILATTWLYAAVKPVLKSKNTPSYDLLALYVLHLVGGILLLGGTLYEHNVLGGPLRASTLTAYSLNVAMIFVLLVAMLSRPVGVPSSYVVKDEIGKNVSPEDYTTLWGWASFTWVEPLISRGTYATLNEKDVWELSSTMRAKPVFLKFNGLKRKTLLRQLWAANSVDITLDFVLTFVSVVFNYAGPFFLKRIIDAIGDSTPEQRAQAYIFAFLAFCSTVLKAESDVQHLWFGRRAAVRIRSQLMSAIYDKALKRKDFSGVVNKDGKDDKRQDDTKSKKDAKADKKAKETADDPKAGADIGKIVNLMAGDSNRIAMIVSGLYFIYGAPFEIIIACTFLYQLLGWSAFAGFVVLLLGWPLNSFIARRSIRISKGVLAARDKRMSVLNEIIGAIKFIKFFAWEDRWIQRAMDSRKHELKWLVKSRINSVMFQILWTTAPILVSVISFFSYVVQGNELTLGTAFTAIALFNMIRAPLNVIPTWIIQILQTRVALQRIETFLNEDEVDEQVSSLKRSNVNVNSSPLAEFGLRNASFRWNVVEEKDKDRKGTTVQKKDTVHTPEATEASSTTVVEISNDESTDRVFELSNISVLFPEGELSVITGPTASGKTALLLALLGEMTLLPGGEIIMSKEPEKIDEHGLIHAISYAAQTPWLQHQSIKENILFGNPFDEARYKEVIECCALLPDLKILEDGDETEIGARGVSLSGGQKARVALARAVYSRTKYVLLDDPLSAVDSHTARFLYERLFLGPLMRHRTVVLVTHHVELVLPGAYYLVRMLDGRIDVQGTVKELRSRDILERVIHDADSEPLKAAEEEPPVNSEENKEQGQEEPENEVDVKAKKPRKLIKDEERESGSVKWSIYKTYLKASSYWTWGILFTIILLLQMLGFTERYWIMIWGEAYGNRGQASFTPGPLEFSASYIEHQVHFSDAIAPHHLINPQEFRTSGIRDSLPPARDRPLFYVGVYALIGLTTVIVSVCSAITQYTGALRASRHLFRDLLSSVVHATMRWQDVTPAGRMLNRFSKDIETVDTTLASSLQAVNSSLANFASSVIVVIVVFPFFVVPASVFGFFYYRLAIGYLNTGRDLRRMESVSRSPIFSGFGELLEGVVTVRAFSAERRFRDNLYSKIDLTLNMWYNFWMLNRWLLLRYDCLSALAVFTTTLFALSGFVDAGWAALSITSAMAFTSNIYWACRFWTTLELDLNSVERVVEYLDLPREPPGIIENSRPPAHWPSSTGPNEESLLVVDNLVIRYAPELPAVLHNVSFSLKARERVGLLGRTGSGKSTLAMSVLRFVDPTEGRIMIDGIDITSIGVYDLRSRLTFIPQDATLFSGTLRDNLDPFGDYSDEDCIDALHRVQMLSDSAYQSQKSSRTASRAASIHSTEDDAEEQGSPSRAPSELSSVTAASSNGNDKLAPKISLDTDVSAGGLNFSAGQRQLIAMARALLRQSSIIVLDEATSSIDFATDAKIQDTIREEFGNSLLLTIAHRLRTVIDYDRLIVLDQGKVAEFDSPWNLINKEGGIFRAMCLKSGTFGELLEKAEKAAKAKAMLKK